MTESVEVAVPPDLTVTVIGFREARGPAGLTDALRMILPEKVPRLVSVTMVVPDPPTRTDSPLGLSVMLKSEVEALTEILFVTVELAPAESKTVNWTL